MRCFRWLLLVVLVLACTDALAEIYRWRDAQGKLHFTDSLQQVPTEYRPGVRDTQGSYDNLNFVKGANSGSSAAVRDKIAEHGSEQEIIIPYHHREGLADRVIVEITFNNRVTAPILVDTGSPGLILSASLARELGLLSEEGNNLFVLVRGIGGSQVAARAILDELSVGPIRERVVPAHIITDQSPAYRGLIGMDVLSGYTLTIDSVRRCLVARKLEPSVDRPGGHDRLWWSRNFRELNAYISYWEAQAVDIGSGSSKYSSLSSRFQNVKDFIESQLVESRKLYERLDRHARDNSVPRHWRE